MQGAEQRSSFPYIWDGVLLAQAGQLCSLFGLQLANVTSADVPGLVDLMDSCMTRPGAFFGYYEALPPIVCNFLERASWGVLNNVATCGVRQAVICEIPLDPVVTTVTTTTLPIGTTTTATSTVTSTVSTVVSTEYILSEVTRTLTSDGTTYTTACGTTTVCATVTRVVVDYCLCDSSSSDCRCSHWSTSCSHCDCSSSSSSSDCQECCRAQKAYSPPSKKPYHRPAAVVASEKRANNGWTQCPNTFAGFAVVRNNSPQPGEMFSMACASQGMHFANVTAELFPNLVQYVIGPCSVSEAAFNSYYGYEAELAVINSLGIALYDAGPRLVGASTSIVDVLCRQGPDVATTSTVFTGPFATASVTKSLTQTQFTSTSTTLTTEVDPTTLAQTSTQFIPSTTTATITVTQTSTQTSWHTAGCCCNPVVCETRRPDCCHTRV